MTPPRPQQPPPQRMTQRGRGGRRNEERKTRTRRGGGRTFPIKGRGTPKEQALAILAQIISTPPGGGPHSGQTLALPPQKAQ